MYEALENYRHRLRWLTELPESCEMVVSLLHLWMVTCLTRSRSCYHDRPLADCLRFKIGPESSVLFHGIYLPPELASLAAPQRPRAHNPADITSRKSFRNKATVPATETWLLVPWSHLHFVPTIVPSISLPHRLTINPILLLHFHFPVTGLDSAFNIVNMHVIWGTVYLHVALKKFAR